MPWREINRRPSTRAATITTASRWSCLDCSKRCAVCWEHNLMGEAITGDALKHLRHELRTPINHVLGYTELLLEECQDSGEAKYRTALEELNRGGRVLLDQIQRSLNYSTGSVTTQHMRYFLAQLTPAPSHLLTSSQHLPSTA